MKRKRGGKLLADLVRPGDKIVVARGGRGGVRKGSLKFHSSHSNSIL